MCFCASEMSKRLLIYSKTTIASRLHHTHTRRLCTLVQVSVNTWENQVTYFKK